MMASTAQRPGLSVPIGNANGFLKYYRDDILSGFLVFLIALPLCMGISLASGFPPIAGIFTAIIGSIVTTFISNAELTIKGPAAGLIVIVLGCVESFGGDGMVGGFSDADMLAYRGALAVSVAAGVLQVVFGLFRAGIIGDFFPTAAVHGMLAAIGVIIISKQFPVALGVPAKGEPLELLREIPTFIREANPAIAFIGFTSVAIMFLWPIVGKRFPILKLVPSPLIVLAVTIPLGMYLDLLHKHSYVLQNHEYQLGEQYLVSMPDRVFGMFDQIAAPNFAVLGQMVAWKWVMMFFIIGTLESLLSAKAVELLDPYKRKVNLDRDVIGVGIANICSALIGGLPMISEIVRSRANIDNGAKTRFANLWHGMFLLVCVALIPMFLHRIPLAALAGMLVYTGFRLAHPSEFLHMIHIGREQLVVFVTTLLAVLATDLLIGIAIGIGVKLCIHLYNGVPIRSLFMPELDVTEIDEQTCRIEVRQSAIFTNWLPFRRQIENLGLLNRKNVIIDLSGANLVDHSVIDKLAGLQDDFTAQELSLSIVGLDDLQQTSDHEHAMRRRGLANVRRLTVVADQELQSWLIDNFIKAGATGYTSVPCTGAGKRSLAGEGHPSVSLVRIEVIVKREVSEKLLDFLRKEVRPDHHITACIERVDVLRLGQFIADPISTAAVGTHH